MTNNYIFVPTLKKESQSDYAPKNCPICGHETRMGFSDYHQATTIYCPYEPRYGDGRKPHNFKIVYTLPG